jgi:hypothetical protein
MRRVAFLRAVGWTLRVERREVLALPDRVAFFLAAIETPPIA